MAKVTEILPELIGEEMVYVQNLIKELSDEEARSFANIYRVRRKDPQVILFTALLGFVVVAGVHRFVINQIGRDCFTCLPVDCV